MDTAFYLAWTLYYLQQYPIAEPVASQVLEWKKRVHGANNPETLDAHRLYGLAIFRQERYGEAEGILQLLWGIQRAGSEANSAKTFETGQVLGQCQMKLRNFLAASRIFKIVLDGRISINAGAALIDKTTELHREAAAKAKAKRRAS
jgi:hypothetical protein